MNKCVWIVNYYTGTPSNVSNPRYIELAKHFMQSGYEVYTFNSSKLAGTSEEQTKSNKVFLNRSYDGLKFVHINAPSYSGNGIKRMYSLWRFAFILKKYAHSYPKPDVILHNIHPPFDYPIVTLAKKLKCKYIAEAWDLWPDAFVYIGLVRPNNPLMRLAYAIEKKYYYSADEIVFTFRGGIDYLKRQRWMKNQGGIIDPEHVHYISNGINIDKFDRDKFLHPRSDIDINDERYYRIVYLGAINFANNVKALVDAAALLKENDKYRFFIYGNGAFRDELEEYVRINGISNVIFKERRISLDECAWVVSQARVGVMNYEKGFGRMGVSSGKMFQYLAAGKPIVCNVSIAYDDVITENRLGIARDMNTPEEFAQAIKSLAEQPKEEYDSMCRRVRRVAECFDYKFIATKEQELLS